jgi:hypothetical protein
MKKITWLLNVGFIVFSICSIGFSQNDNGCTAGKRNGIAYTNCWADTGDDTARLQSAIAAPSSVGKLIFNEENYTISDELPVYAFRILEGNSVNTGAGFNTSKITQTTPGKAIFRIGAGVFDVSIRDLGLVGQSGSGIGIYAAGQYSQGGSARFQFSNLRFSGLDKGIYVYATTGDGGWQFDNVKLDNATFEACNTAILIDASDSGWHMANVNIVAATGQYGIRIPRGGYMSMNLIVGNGFTNGSTDPAGGPLALSETFIEIGEHSVISIQNSVAENFKRSLFINSLQKDTPIHLINNAFGEKVEINNSHVVSTGNFYGNFWGVSNPVIKGKSDVFSIGDRFCWEFSTHCTASKFVVQGTTATLQQMASSDNSSTDLTRPAFKILQPSIGKNLLELGNFNAGGEYVYRLKRDSLGRLNFTASQSDPWKGYTFDGTVRLASYLKANLPSGTTANGDMVYCSDCKPSTTPCQAAGTGALAIIANGQWSCR